MELKTSLFEAENMYLRVWRLDITTTTKNTINIYRNDCTNSGILPFRMFKHYSYPYHTLNISHVFIFVWRFSDPFFFVYGFLFLFLLLPSPLNFMRCDNNRRNKKTHRDSYRSRNVFTSSFK